MGSSNSKSGLSRSFQEFKQGDVVAIVRESSVSSKFPARLQGTTGIVEGNRGKSYMVEIKDKNKKKKFLIEPVHLKRIKQLKHDDKK